MPNPVHVRDGAGCPGAGPLAPPRGSVTVGSPRAVAPGFRPSGGLARRGFRVRNFTYDEGRSCDAVLALAAARALPIVTKRGVPPAQSISSARRPESFAPRVILRRPGSPYKKVTLQNSNPVAGHASSDAAALAPAAAAVSAAPAVPTV